MLTKMEYHDPDEVIPRNSPLLFPHNLTLGGPPPLEPWSSDPEGSPHDEPWELGGLLEREPLSYSVREDRV